MNEATVLGSERCKYRTVGLQDRKPGSLSLRGLGFRVDVDGDYPA